MRDPVHLGKGLATRLGFKTEERIKEVVRNLIGVERNKKKGWEVDRGSGSSWILSAEPYPRLHPPVDGVGIKAKDEGGNTCVLLKIYP